MALFRGKTEWLGGIWLLLLRIALIAAVAYCLWRVRFILATTLAAVMLAYAVLPLTVALERLAPFKILRYRPRRLVCTTIVFALLGVLVFWTASAIARPLVMEVREFFESMDVHAREFDRRFEAIKSDYDRLPDQVKKWLESLDYGSMMAGIGNQLKHVVEQTAHYTMFLVDLILIPVLAFYFVTESGRFKKEFAFLVPRRRWRDAIYLLRESSAILQSYVVGQFILAVLAGVVVWGLLQGLGVHYSLVLGVVAGVTRAIPIVGPIIGGIPIVLLATLQSWEKGLAVLVAFTLLHLIESKLIMPKLIGYRINLHPAIIIIVLLIGYEFWGMWGMFVAAPVAAIIKVMINHFWVRPARRLTRRWGAPLKSTREETGIERGVERPAVVGTGSHPGSH